MQITEQADWRGTVKNKWIIFDSDAIISILEFKAESIFDELKKLGASFTYIPPVQLELMNTDNAKEKVRRSKLLNDFEFVRLPLTVAEIEYASRIQESLPLALKCKPSATDLYLGATLAKHNHKDKAYLLTANLRDFPLPLYPRIAFIHLQNPTNVKVLSLLAIDLAQLINL